VLVKEVEKEEIYGIIEIEANEFASLNVSSPENRTVLD